MLARSVWSMPTTLDFLPEHAVEARACAEQCYRETRRVRLLFAHSEEWPEAEAVGYAVECYDDYFVLALDGGYDYHHETIFYEQVIECEAEVL